jgi:N-acetylglucosamine kinase-like BadF-type ATPase
MAEASGYLIGVDGGGTKTVAWLVRLSVDGGEVVLGKGQAGPGNPRAVGFEVAQTNIEAAIAAAFAEARLPRTAARAACLGLAGAGRTSEQEQIQTWAVSRGIAEQVDVVADIEPVLAAASPENIGVALVCGTGSLVWGRNRAGETARCGGWGYLLGDEGSAYAIALAGLRAAVRAADGRGPATSMLSRLQERLAAATAADLIDRVYQADMTRERIAQLAEVVFEAAPGDEVARQLIEAGAAELRAAVGVVARRLNFAPGEYPLALAGSVLLRQDDYRNLVCSKLLETGTCPNVAIAVPDPVSGAVVLARRAAGYPARQL